jgi:hypothetical protein
MMLGVVAEIRLAEALVVVDVQVAFVSGAGAVPAAEPLAEAIVVGGQELLYGREGLGTRGGRVRGGSGGSSCVFRSGDHGIQRIKPRAPSS